MNFGENYMNNFADTVHVFEKNRKSCGDNRSHEVQEETEFEWEHFENAVLNPDISDEISFEEAASYLRTLDLSGYEDIITTSLRRKSISKCLMCLQPTQIKPKYRNDYNLLFLIAKCPYDSNDDKHVSMLRSVYWALVPERNLDYYWTDIGFQSNCPWTDLRGVGMLGVLQMLYLHYRHSALTKYLYSFSIVKQNSFPFAVVSLNMTTITLDTLRRGKLNGNVNKRGAFDAANEHYSILFHAFGKIWQRNGMTISDAGIIFRDLRKMSYSKRGRRKMSRDLMQFLRSNAS